MVSPSETETGFEKRMSGTVFSEMFGIWGVSAMYSIGETDCNGVSATRVASAVDDFVETMEGFEPPVFVDRNDIRIKTHEGDAANGIASLTVNCVFDGEPSRPPEGQYVPMLRKSGEEYIFPPAN